MPTLAGQPVTASDLKPGCLVSGSEAWTRLIPFERTYAAAETLVFGSSLHFALIHQAAL